MILAEFWKRRMSWQILGAAELKQPLHTGCKGSQSVFAPRYRLTVSTFHADLGRWRWCSGASSCREPCGWCWSSGWSRCASPCLRPSNSAFCNARPRTVLTSRCAPSHQNRCNTPSRYRRSCSSLLPWRSSQCSTLSSAWSCDAPGSFMRTNGRPSEAAVLREATTAPPLAGAARHRTTSSACLVSRLAVTVGCGSPVACGRLWSIWVESR